MSIGFTSDIILLQYNTSGHHIWTRLAGTNGLDKGYGVTINQKGDIYTVGFASKSLNGKVAYGDMDIVLLSYNSSGLLIWTSQTGTTDPDCGFAIALSEDEMYIYITGYASEGLNGKAWAGIIVAVIIL